MIEPIGVISYDNIIRPLKGLLFFIVDKYRCDACNSGETAGTHDEGSNTSGGNMPDGGSTDDSADVGLE